MNEISKFIRDNIVKKELNNKTSIRIATIIEYDKINNIAKIEYTNPSTGGMIKVDKVNVCIESAGLIGIELRPEDTVLINVESSMKPTIIKRIDKYYKFNTRAYMNHKRQGAYLPIKLNERK